MNIRIISPPLLHRSLFRIPHTNTDLIWYAWYGIHCCCSSQFQTVKWYQYIPRSCRYFRFMLLSLRSFQIDNNDMRIKTFYHLILPLSTILYCQSCTDIKDSHSSHIFPIKQIHCHNAFNRYIYIYILYIKVMFLLPLGALLNINIYFAVNQQCALVSLRTKPMYQCPNRKKVSFSNVEVHNNSERCIELGNNVRRLYISFSYE